MEKKRDNGQQVKAQHVMVLTAWVLHFSEGGKKDKLK